MTRRCAFAACVALILSILAIPAQTGAQAPDSAGSVALVEEILADGGYQLSLDAPPDPERHILLPPWMAAPLQLLMWAVLLLLLALGAFYLIAMFRGRGVALDEDASEQLTIPADPAWADAGLRSADELAREGLITEALHVLLLAALNELRRRGGVEIRDSLTSREILSRVSLPEGSDTPLRELVREVEFAFFGGRTRGPDDYRRGREQFERVRVAMVGGVA